MDVLDRADLPFPHSLPEFQRLFPDDAACAAYLEKARWGDGFACPHCGTAGEPFHFENRPGVLRCRKCRQNTGLTVGTVMERSHTPLNVWFWAAYLVASQTPGMSAVQFQRQLGLSRYETAFQILHKLRSGMVRPICQWRSKKGPPWRCKKGPLGGCGLVPVVHGRAPRATRRALNRPTRRRAREGPVGPRGQVSTPVEDSAKGRRKRLPPGLVG